MKIHQSQGYSNYAKSTGARVKLRPNMEVLAGWTSIRIFENSELVENWTTSKEK